MPKTSKKRQRIYKMKGCSKKNKKFFLGGTNLAYPSSSVPTIPPPLAYTGKGGSTVMPTNTDAANPALPNTGPKPMSLNWIGSQTTSGGSMKGGNYGCGIPVMSGGTCMSCQYPLMTGGCCGESQPSAMTGGNCGPSCALGYQAAGKRRTNKGKKRAMKGGNPGIPYPNGLVGKSWTPAISGWPGVDGISGNRNFLANNTYNTDISRQMVSPGANPPFITGGKKQQKSRLNRTRTQRGGTLSNFLAQDLINLGRQVQFGLGSAYNAFAGYSAPVNPLPWKDQLVNTPNLSSIKYRL